jgi:flagellar protein FlgJ
MFLALLNKAVDDTSEKPDKRVKVKDEKLMNVCIEMESLFVARMLKEMRNTVHKNALLHGGFAEEVFEDMLYDEYALRLSKTSNLGLAKMLYEELSKR